MTREIKKDGKGLFIYYGSYRLRPTGPTVFEEGEVVRIDSKSSVSGMIVENSGVYEQWTSLTWRQ